MFVEPSENSSSSFFYLLESRRHHWVGIWQLHILRKEIADRLCISRHTVDNHLRNIRERFGLHKNTEIILLYIAHLNHKPFSLSNIKQYGLEVILVLINVCTYTDLKSL